MLFEASHAPKSATISAGGGELSCKDNYWHALVQPPIGRGTGIHSITFKITKGNAACVGMGAPSQDMGEVIGFDLDNSVGLKSNGYLNANKSVVRVGVESYTTGDEVRVECDSSTGTVSWYINGVKVAEWTGVGDGWHFAVGGWQGTTAFAIVGSSAAATPAPPAQVQQAMCVWGVGEIGVVERGGHRRNGKWSGGIVTMGMAARPQADE